MVKQRPIGSLVGLPSTSGRSSAVAIAKEYLTRWGTGISLKDPKAEVDTVVAVRAAHKASYSNPTTCTLSFVQSGAQ